MSIKSHNFHPILTWENPIKSGTVLAEIIGVIAILRYANILRFSLKLTYFAIGITGAVEFITRHFYGSSQGLVSSYRPSRYINTSPVSIEKYTSYAAGVISGGISEAKKLLDAEDLSLSLISFISIFILYFLTGFLSASTLILIVAISSFSIPPIYLKFQKEIDELIAHFHKQAGDHYTQIHGQVLKAAGPHLDVAKKHINTVASAVGINRGGFPVGSTGAKQEIPTTPIHPSEIPGAPAISVTEPVPEKKAPKLSEEATDILKSHDATKDYQSVPTILGTVSLDPHESSEPTPSH